MEIAGRSEKDAVVVCVFADSGLQYLSVEGLFEE
jgi:hypothetical protein